MCKIYLICPLWNGLPRFDASEKNNTFVSAASAPPRMKKPFASDMKFSALLLALAAAATFTAAPAQTVQTAQTEKKPPVRILFLCDLHVSPDTPSEDRLRRAVRKINATDADAVIVAGDLTNEGSDEELRCVKSILDLIELPTYVIPGNH